VLKNALPKGIVHLEHRCVGLSQHDDRVEVRFDMGRSPMPRC
jgi:hypothetical protein